VGIGLAVVTDYKILGANYGLIVLPSWGRTSVEVKAEANLAGTVSVGRFSRSFAAGRTVEIEDQSTAFIITPTWEWHSNKSGADIQPGQNFTIAYGIGQYLHERFEIGLSGFHQWQITDDSGIDAVNTNIKDGVNGVAGQFTWWAVKDKCALVGKYVHEYGAEDRFEGWCGQINLTWIF
jgi:hypothetical protein